MRYVSVSLFLTALLLIVVGMFPLVARADVDPHPVHVAAGVQGAWLDGSDASLPAALEAGGTAWSSLSPHLSFAGGVFAGLSSPWVRYQADLRATVTDIENPNFDSYVAIRFRGGSTHATGPAEWAGVAGVGWRPLPKLYDALTIGADAGYGVDSKHLVFTLLGRWELPLP